MTASTFLPHRTAIAMATAAVLGFGAAGTYRMVHAENTPSVQALVASAATPTPAGLPDLASIAKRYGSAVVNISVSGTRKVAMNGAEDDSDDNSANDSSSASGNTAPPNGAHQDFLRRFQQQFGGLPPGMAPGTRVPMRGEGSGFIVQSDGVILTNAHVVRGAQEVMVKLTDRREFRAKVLGADPKTDIAVLKIDAKDLPTVVFAPAKQQPQVGEWVLAIGSPFGFENSVSAGIVSAKGRSLPGETYVPFIQTDVAVNPGNSGGPLFNLAGEVIGINSQIYSRSGGYQGLSFAIPIDVALRVKDQIVATGRASRARLGVTVQEVNQALAESFGLKRTEGALVVAVQPGSAAERAGLLPGDVILKFDGKPIGAANELSALVGQAAPGSKARLEVWRRGESKELSATLGTAQADTNRNAAAEGPGKDRLGLAVRPLTPEERKEANVTGGLLVQDVNGAAARAGMQPGDIVLMADGKPVKSVEDLRAVTGSRGNVALLVQRGETRVFVPLKTG